jgi:hypothetical protein
LGSGQEVDGVEDGLLFRQVRLGCTRHVVDDEHQALAVDVEDVNVVDLARSLVVAPQPAVEEPVITIGEVNVGGDGSASV